MKNFIKRNKFIFLGLFFLGFLIYGVRICNYVISIDTEIFINESKQMLDSWIAINRFGLVALKNIFNLVPINIILTNAISFLLFYFSTIIWIWNLSKLTNKDSRFANFVFGAVILSSQLLAEQFAFTLQSLEISIGLLLMSISILLIEKEKKILYIPAIIFLSFSFSLYQAFVILFILISVFYVLVKCKNEINLKLVLKYISLFVIAFLIYYLTSKLVIYFTNVNTSEYLSTLIYWGTESPLKTATRMVVGVGITVLGYGFDNSLSYLFIFLLGTVCVLKKYKIKENKLFYLCYIFMFFVPLSMTIIKGAAETYRSRFAMAYFTAFALYYLALYTQNNAKKVTLIIVTYTLLFQVVVTTLLFYSDYKRYNEDVNLAKEINSYLKKIDADKPIIFIGEYKTKDVLIKGEVLGNSYFEWDASTDYGINARMPYFMKLLNYDYEFVSVENMERIKEESINMSVWPDKNSIEEKDEYIIIKIGEEPNRGLFN